MFAKCALRYCHKRSKLGGAAHFNGACNCAAQHFTSIYNSCDGPRRVARYGGLDRRQVAVGSHCRMQGQKDASRRAKNSSGQCFASFCK